MITLTIVERVKQGKIVKPKRTLKIYHNTDKVRKEVVPIVHEMNQAKKQKREPDIRIDAVSYDYNSEKKLLLELGAIVSTENESQEE